MSLPALQQAGELQERFVAKAHRAASTAPRTGGLQRGQFRNKFSPPELTVVESLR
jgi:hypothetical protein